jgi:hypothetical protein
LKNIKTLSSIKAAKLVYFLFFLCANTIKAQTYTLAQKITISTQTFTTDKLQQIYLVTPEGEIIKMSADSTILGKYSNKKLGAVESVDATNPFSILVYYRDFQTIVLLNRSMIETNTYSLADLYVSQAGPVAVGEDNSLWLYDLGASKLRKFITEGNTIKGTNTTVMQFKGAKPNKLMVKDGEVFMNAPEHGLFAFDLYGKFERKYDFKGLTDFQIVEKQIVFRQAGEFFRYSTKTFGTVPMKLPPGITADANIRVERGKLYVRTNTELQIWDAK